MDMPWFAWIAIAGIIVYGVINVTGIIAGRGKDFLDSKRIVALEEKVRMLEAGQRSDPL